ncbi:MAG TPA: diguanylate cyclase [Steroidobacteraceae bacterium]|nr:diguanylate cyclase [Steroidobacteraceae bacterium]
MTANWAAADTKDPVEALIANSKLAMRGDPEVSKRDAEAALDLLKHTPNVDQEIRARMQLCDYYSERSRPKAEQQAQLMEALLPAVQRKGLAAGVLHCQGQIQESQANFTEALNLYNQAVTIARKNSDGEMLAESLFQRGYVFGLQGQYANGLADLREAQTLFDEVGLPHAAMTALSSVATLYNRLGDYDQAMHIYQRALTVQHKNNMQREELVTTYNMGSVEEHLEHWEKAKERFNAALQLGEQLNYTRAQAYALRGLAVVANSTDEPEEALELLEKASNLQLDVPDSRLHAQILQARGTALRKLSRTSESIAALEEAKRIFAQADSVNELSNVYTQLALAYAQAGSWRKAYEVRTQGQQLSESMLHNQLDQRFATLKIEFDTANKEKENALLLRENAANQKALEHATTAHKLQTVVIALSAILLILLGTMVWHQRRGKHHMHSLAMTDELTGVPNRRSVLSKLGNVLEKSDLHSCAMLIIDIDHFKSINDRYGHPIGDEIIKVTANHLRLAVNDPAFSGRLGGEEFVLILPEHSADLALTIAENLRSKVADLDLSHWLGERRITISIGMTMAVSGDSTTSMLRRADSALYAAKHAGRNCVRVEPPFESADKGIESASNKEEVAATESLA